MSKKKSVTKSGLIKTRLKIGVKTNEKNKKEREREREMIRKLVSKPAVSIEHQRRQVAFIMTDGDNHIIIDILAKVLK